VKLWFLKNSNVSGIYNVGTGLSRAFNDIANAVIKYFNYGKINYIDFPDNLESQYQAYTQADMTNLKKVGYLDNFTTLESGVEKYLDWLSNNL
jgi:ADP-L-glycero-D-manno-heptose 6-epimerase